MCARAGILFTRISLDAFDGVLAGALAELDDLLARAPVAQGGGGASRGANTGAVAGRAGAADMTRRSDAVIAQLAAMAIFAAWNMTWSPPGAAPGCGPWPLSCVCCGRHLFALHRLCAPCYVLPALLLYIWGQAPFREPTQEAGQLAGMHTTCL
jgi:hypothetical protein